MGGVERDSKNWPRFEKDAPWLGWGFLLLRANFPVFFYSFFLIYFLSFSTRNMIIRFCKTVRDSTRLNSIVSLAINHRTNRVHVFMVKFLTGSIKCNLPAPHYLFMVISMLISPSIFVRSWYTVNTEIPDSLIRIIWRVNYPLPKKKKKERKTDSIFPWAFSSLQINAGFYHRPLQFSIKKLW